MSRVRIKQIRSTIDRSIKQKRTMKALGLNKINSSVEHEMNPNIKGMIFKVSHLVEVEELGGGNSSTPKTESVAAATKEEE